MTEIGLWLFYDFADLAVKCLFGAIRGVLEDFDPLKLWNYCFDPKDWYAVPGETRVMRYCALKSV